jgi:hypothetical protein
MHRDRRGYVYESFRDGGRVCRRYVGAGDTVALALKLEQLKRRLKERADSKNEAEREEQRQEVEIPVALLDAQTSEILEALLLAAGYHRPQRGPWRKRRQKPMSNAIEKARQSQFKALTERAENGDLEAAREFWSQVDGNAQTRAELVKQTGDMASMALSHLMAKITQGNHLMLGGIRRQLDAMRSDLGGANPSPLELLLIDRVCVCWLQLHFFEVQVTLAPETDSLEQLTFRQKQADGANRRYLSSIKALAQVRKLQLPTLQINMAEKQVNIGQMSGRSFGE